MVFTTIFFKWFRQLPLRSYWTALYNRLPSRTTAITIALSLLVAFVVSLLLFYAVARVRFPFWSKQPVAHPTILPASDGRVVSSNESSYSPTLPDGYVVERVRRLSTMTGDEPLWRDIARLWRRGVCEDLEPVRDNGPDDMSSTDFSTGTSAVPVPSWSYQRIYDQTRYPRTQLFVVMHARRSPPYQEHDNHDEHDEHKKDARVTIRTNPAPALVATLLCTPTTIDTPVDTELDVFLGDRLFVHPDHRGKGLVPALLTEAVRYARHRARHHPPHPEHSEPVGLFAVELDFDSPDRNRLPFGEVAGTVRVFQTVTPALLVDPESDVAHQAVTSLRRLPSRAYESSGVRTHGNTHTLEPSATSNARKLWWAHIIRHPDHHTLLSIGGQDWIHLAHDPVASLPSGKPDGTHRIVQLLGCSFDHAQCDQLPPHLYAHLRSTYGTHPTVKRVTIVIPQPLQRTFQQYVHTHLLSRERTSSSEPARTKPDWEDAPTDPHKWHWYDAHHVYMYNYRLRRKGLDVPFTFDLPLL